MIEENGSMTVQQLYDYIVSKMPAEKALFTLLQGPLGEYKKMKFAKGEEVHPLIIMATAALEMGWDFVIEKETPENKEVRGLITGTSDYIESLKKVINVD